MKVVRDIAKMQELSHQLRAGGSRVGLVPTMGYLHEGHLALVRRARELADTVVVSVFVNPAQFNDAADLAAYPTDDAGDLALLEAEGVEIAFLPARDAVYRDDASTRVVVDGLGERLCGATRPGHFDGVATVVAALLNMVGPDLAVFGEKDYQQLQIVRRLVRDLHFPVEIHAVPTVRESDGLALSSRNARLSPRERALAPRLSQALARAAQMFARGETDATKLVACARGELVACEGLELEYLELIDGASIEPLESAREGAVLAAAAWLGGVRLIDNVALAAAPGGKGRDNEPARAAELAAEPRPDGRTGRRRGDRTQGGMASDA